MQRFQLSIEPNHNYSLAWILFGAAILFSTNAFCQESKSAAKPVTTADVEIPIEILELLLKPLTKEELIVEANGWQDLLKQKAQDIAKIRIRLASEKQTARKSADAAQRSTNNSEETAAEKSPDEQQAADVADQAAANVKEAQDDLKGQLRILTEGKVQIEKRMKTVLDALELKGGDPSAYREYTSALAGIAVDASDAGTFFTILTAWVFSEDGGKRWLWNIAKFLLILILFYFGASLVAGLVSRATSRVRGTSTLLSNFLYKFVKQLMMIIGFIIALAALEVNITPLLAAMGAAGFVIGFALQGTLSNFASGLLILAYRPFDVGDSIDAAGVSGTVDSVSLFSTLIRSFDNKLMIVPNNDIWGGTITNSTASDTRRVDMVFGIGYDDDIEKAKQLLQSIVSSHELVLMDPVPVIRVNELSDSSVNLICRPWTQTSNYWALYWDLNESVKLAFDRNNISIPYPQTDVHIHQDKA